MIGLQASPVSQGKNGMMPSIKCNLSPKGNNVFILFLLLPMSERPQPIRLVFHYRKEGLHFVAKVKNVYRNCC